MEENLWKIKEIKVTGLLGRKNIDWKLFPKVNILGASNGAGKSTILHALYLLFDASGSDKETHTEAYFREISAELYSGTTVSLHRVLEKSSERIECIPPIEGKIKMRVKENINFERSFSPMPETEEPLDFPRHVLYINSADLAVKKIYEMRDNAPDEKRPNITVLDTLVREELNTRNELFYRRMSPAMQRKDEEEIDRLGDLFGRFEKVLKVFMPDYKLVDDTSLLFAPVDEPKELIPYFRLSTGEKQLCYLLLSVANTLGESTILLLDEADLGLHIDWKKILLRELFDINPNMQIIAATHSPSLINGWYDQVKEISQLYI